MNRNSIYYQAKASIRPSGKSFFINLTLMIGAALLMQQFLPWYGVWISCALVAIFRAHTYASGFFMGFLSIFLVWSVHSLAIDIENASILSSRVIKLFPLPPHSFFLVMITGIIGGLAGGVGAATGRSLARLFR